MTVKHAKTARTTFLHGYGPPQSLDFLLSCLNHEGQVTEGGRKVEMLKHFNDYF